MRKHLRKALKWALDQLGDDDEPKEERVELAIATCGACQTSYRAKLFSQLPLIARSDDKTKSGDHRRREKRRCACGNELTVDWQHVEDHEYSMPRRMYDRLYGN